VTVTSPGRVGVRTQRTAVAAAFLVQGLLFISLTLRLPQLKDLFGLSDLQLAGLMLLLVLLAGAGSVAAGLVARVADSALAVRVALVLVAAGFVVVGLSTRGSGSLPVLVAGMGLYGLGLGANDAASNMQAVAIEHRLGRPVMPSFHAAWTAGGLLATLGAITLPDVNLALGTAALAVLPLAVTAAPFLRRDHGSADLPAGAAGAAEGAGVVGVLWRTVWLVGIGLVLFYAVDTAVTAWGPVYLSSDTVFTDPPTSPAMYALATLPYLVATLVARLAGDPLTARLGAPTMVRAGAVTAFVGLAVVVFAPASTWQVAIVGFFVVGLGVAVIAPLSFSAAARVAGAGSVQGDPRVHQARVDAVVARFNQFNYAGALIGSVLTGAVGTNNLRVGFAVPMLLVLGLLPLARHFATAGPTE
jgi:sugar phosphate permease